MSEKLFTVMELCREFDVTPRALRFYEQKGLLQPQRAGNRRRYKVSDRARLYYILRGKKFGFSLQQIGELLALYNADSLHLTQLEQTLIAARERMQILREQRAALDEAIGDLAEQMREIDGLVAQKKASVTSIRAESVHAVS